MADEQTVVQPVDDVKVTTKVTKKRNKVEVDADGNPIKKKRNTRSSKYPLVKRKCRNAYQIYINEQAVKNKEEGGESKTPADYAAAWKAEEDKTRWKELAKQELQEYINEVRAHGYTYEDKKSGNRGDKKPSGPFLLYARDHHKQVQQEMNVTYAQALTELGRRWKGDDIDPKLKQKYIDHADKEKKLYDERKAKAAETKDNN